MTETSIALCGLLAIAVLGTFVKVVDYINKNVFPSIRTLAENISELKTGHALSQQQIVQNTARLNGQSAKIDTIMLGSPAEALPVTIAPRSESSLANLTSATNGFVIPSPRPINVTINADAPMSADELKTAHDKLDAQATGQVQVPGGSPDGSVIAPGPGVEGD